MSVLPFPERPRSEGQAHAGGGELVPFDVRTREADLRVTIRFWRQKDDSVRVTWSTEEYVVEGQPELPTSWLRWALRWGLLFVARDWRLGLVRRAPPHQPRPDPAQPDQTQPNEKED